MTLDSGSGTDTGEPADAGTGEGGTGAGAGEGASGTTSSTLVNGQTGGQGGDKSGDRGVQSGNTFLDFISDSDLKQDPNLQHIQNTEELAKSYVNAQKLVGKDKIPLPSDENDSAAWNDVLKKLGRPEDPSGYELPQPAEDSPIQIREDVSEQFKQKSHELGLTAKQAQDLWGWYVGEVAEGEAKRVQDQMEEMRVNAEKELRKEFGNAFETKLQDARRAAEEYGGEDLLNKLESTGLGNDPTMLKFLAQVGSQFREDTVGGSAPQIGRTPDQAKQELQEKKADSDFMAVYMDNTKTGHDAAVKKMQQLYKDAYPDQ